MAACRNGTGGRRRGFFTLSGVAALAVVAVGVVLWQGVELSSLSVVSQRVDQAKPLLGGLRLALIGLLVLFWPWLYGRLDDEPARARWRALRWRIAGWLLVIELIIGQNLFGRFVGVLALAA